MQLRFVAAAGILRGNHWAWLRRKPHPFARGRSRTTLQQELDTVNWERINTHMKKIYEKNLTNIKCDQHLPAFQEWAHTLMSVSPTSPPSSIPYLTLKGAKKDRINNSTPPKATTTASTSNTFTNDQLGFLVSLLTGNHAEPDGRHSSPAVIPSSPPDECDIEGYVSFLGIRDKENIFKKLMANGFHSNKVFKSPGLLCADVRGLGLTLGVVTLHFDNVSKYDHYLALNR
ncbi:hypothetical protein VP01_1052g2 [Puccinia sorghi]|uniref:Uncharacterized protein n=1 Tax=Puccinia sorghi TaxID=27349 RepID=A0A0L6VU73_9BASI|nr:hypothetical protein VP01_1052g2 [Puccinia sorghi]